MKESPFSKLVDLLTVVNDLDKRGYEGQITPALIESLVVEAVSRYNMDYSLKRPINNPNQPQPQQVQPMPAPGKHPHGQHKEQEVAKRKEEEK